MGGTLAPTLDRERDSVGTKADTLLVEVLLQEHSKAMESFNQACMIEGCVSP
jgi:hypothetical protein